MQEVDIKLNSDRSCPDALTSQLTDLLFSRDECALQRIDKLFGKAIRSVSFGICRNSEDVDEITNDVLGEVWDSIPPQRPRSMISFVCMIARRRSIDRVRRETAQKRRYTEYYDAVAEIESHFRTDDAVIERISFNEAMDRFLSSQEKENRQIFLMRYYDLMPVKTIASRMSMSKNAVNLRLVRMRQMLIKEIGIKDI